jgi:cobalt-zinc-cadmium efflux system protein
VADEQAADQAAHERCREFHGVASGEKSLLQQRVSPVGESTKLRIVGHDHSHGVSADADSRKLAIALALILAFMCVEVAAGIAAQSLALLSDAAHMLTDAGALALSLVAIRLARRPAAGAMTYGLKRSEILAAAINGTTLLVLGILIVIEGVRRIVDPPDVEGGLVLAVAILGIAVNLAATMILARANRDSLNVEGAFQHIVTDLAAFVATAIAGAIVLATGFGRADGIAALFVAALMLRAASMLLRESGRVFLEAAPRGLDPEAIGHRMAAHNGVTEVHDLHVWEVTSGFPALSAHVIVGRNTDCHDVRRTLEAMLHDDFEIEHTTLQVEHEGGDLLEIEVSPRG